MLEYLTALPTELCTRYGAGYYTSPAPTIHVNETYPFKDSPNASHDVGVSRGIEPLTHTVTVVL